MNTAKTKDNTKVRPFASAFHRGPRSGSNDTGSERASYTEYGQGVVFEDDASDSAEFLATIRRKVAIEPERHLMLAMLEDAVVSFQKNMHARTPKKRVQFEEAEAWILDEKDHALFSFESVCNILDIEPSYVRRGLLEWKKQNAKVRGTAPAKAA